LARKRQRLPQRDTGEQETIRSSIARTMWVTSWASWIEENTPEETRKWGGQDLFDIAPPTPKRSSTRFNSVEARADQFIAEFEKRNKQTLEGAYVAFQQAITEYGSDESRELTADRFGHYLVMEAQGQGVGLWEWRKHDLKIPSLESLSIDWYPEQGLCCMDLGCTWGEEAA